MPHKSRSHRSNHFLTGSIFGIVFGTILFFFASGSWGLIIVNPSYIPVGKIILLLIYLGAWVFGAYNIVAKKALINNYVDGFIIGCAFTTQTLSWIRYGIQIP